jgi:chaperone modulatory protein CbpM
MSQLERDFDAVPELAALVADLIEELDELRARVHSAGPG